MSYINQLTLTELSLNSEAYGATSNATISTDDNGDINLNTVSGTVNISGSDTQTISSPNNLYIQSGTSTNPMGLNLEGYSITLTPSDTGSTAIALAGNTSVGNSTTSANLTVTGSMYLDSTSGPYITTGLYDISGNIDLVTTSGTVTIYGSDEQTISAPNNLYIQSGSSTALSSMSLEANNITLTPTNTASTAITLAGNTSVGNSTTSANLTVTGTTTLAGNTSVGNSTTSANLTVTGTTTLGTNSAAISNIQYGSQTFSNLSASSAGYTSGSTINLTFTPSSITFGVGIALTSTTNLSTSINYPATVQYVQTTSSSGYTWACTPSLYLPIGNDSTECSYIMTWIAIA
jgi:hypothetical protein